MSPDVNINKGVAETAPLKGIYEHICRKTEINGIYLYLVYIAINPGVIRNLLKLLHNCEDLLH